MPGGLVFGGTPKPKASTPAAAATVPPIPPPPGFGDVATPTTPANFGQKNKAMWYHADGTPVVGAANKKKGDYFGLPKGGAGAAAGGGGAPAGAGTESQPNSFNTNTATTDPYLKVGAEAVKKRIEDPSGSTNRAIDVATSKIRDAGEGQAQGIRNMLASRGVAGTGVEASAMGGLAAAQQRDIAGASANIALDREKSNDAFMLGATGALGAPGSAERADRSLGLSAQELELQRWRETQADRRATEALASSNYLAYLQAVLSL